MSRPAADRITYVGYPLAEDLCQALASELRELLADDLRHWAFVPIPRGGLLVLGMLSYLLGLERSQVAPTALDTGWRGVVLVDDCALSGRRFAQALEPVSAAGIPRVVFAHLLSRPELRRAITEAEPTVEHCLAAHDLPLASSQPPAEVWESWRRRLPGRRYWLGLVEPVIFAWSSPDVVFWNRAEGRIEDRWRRGSPLDHLDGRAAAGLPAGRSTTSRDLAEGVLWRMEEDRVLLWRPGQDRHFGLEGPGVDVWRALLCFGATDTAVRYLAERYEASEEKLARDLEELAGELVAAGLLTP